LVSWSEFADAAPGMAERGYRQLSIPLAYMATVRKDGSPRLHPLSPIFADGRLFVAIEATAPRRFDLQRDGRYSLHALPPMLGPDYDEFEFNVTGRARRVTDPATLSAIAGAERARGRPGPRETDWVFELDIQAALTTVWDHEMEKVGDEWLPKPAAEVKANRQTWSAA
jgi:hypothetical protein